MSWKVYWSGLLNNEEVLSNMRKGTLAFAGPTKRMLGTRRSPIRRKHEKENFSWSLQLVGGRVSHQTIVLLEQKR